jgi:FkbM family methyltransferase
MTSPRSRQRDIVVRLVRRTSTSRLPSRLREIVVYRAGAWLARSSPAGSMVPAPLPANGVVLVPVADPGFRRLWLGLPYEPEIVEFARRVIRPGDVVLDVGANLGVHTLLFASLVGPSGRVHAFEPNPRPASVLAKSLRLNGWTERVAVHPVALSDYSGKGELFVHPDTDLISGLDRQEWLGSADVVPTGVEALDDITAFATTPIRLLKVDVEGAEEAVLKGARRLLSVNPPDYLAVEVSSVSDAQPLMELLLDAGYSVVEPSGAPLAARPGSLLPQVSAAAPGEPGFNYWNLLLRHRAVAA